MKKLRNYFIGDFLSGTDDVFEQARAIMLYRFSVFFAILFLIPLSTDILLGYYKGAMLHGVDTVLIIVFIFLLRGLKDLDKRINFFFTLCYSSSIMAFMVFNPMHIDKIGLTWSFTFVTLSALLQRGVARILCVSIFAWLPLTYVLLNIKFNGALTVPFLVQAGTENPPGFLIVFPVTLSIFAVWGHTNTTQRASDTITQQKHLIEEKNKDITDSIVYAKRIQQSLLPQEKFIEKTLNRLMKRGNH